MRVFVLIAARYGEGCHTQYPPSVWQLQRCVRARSSAAFQATSGGFLWTRDALFGVLRRRHTCTAPAATSSSSLALFTAFLDVGECEEDVDVVAMLLVELCVCWPTYIAAHVEVCRADAGAVAVGSGVAPIAREETLLLLLADEVEATPASQTALLSRWGVADAWDYTAAVQGRCWLVSGGVVAILPADPTGKLVARLLNSELADTRVQGTPRAQGETIDHNPNLGSAIEDALSRAVLEKSLTCALHTGVMEAVRRKVESRPLHRCVAAVPPAMALLLRRLPSRLLHECVLFHTVDCPLAPLAADRTAPPLPLEPTSAEEGGAAGVVAPVRSGNALAVTPQRMTSAHRYRVADEESRRVADLFHEYDLLLSNEGSVRVPLAPVTRYVFAQLLCRTELPAALMLPFIHQHATAVARGGSLAAGLEAGLCASTPRAAATEEEVVLGMKLTWAVSRWTAAMRRHDTASTTSFAAWNRARIAAQDELGEWVRRRMRAARKAASELDFNPHEGPPAAAATTAVHANAAEEADVAAPSSRPHMTPVQRQRVVSLGRLEEKLFAPHPRAYRGSSTEWVQEALRDVGAAQARDALDLAPEDAAAGEALHGDSASDASSAVDDTASESSSSRAADEHGDAAGRSAQQDETSRMLEQLSELESVLQRELDDRNGGRSATPSSGPNAASWLTASELREVARNELFQHHVHLLESEMAPRTSQ